MSLTLELPTPLEDELSREAQREDLSPEEHATILLCLATAIHDKGKQATPFQKAVQGCLSSHSIDAERVASALDALIRACSGYRGRASRASGEVAPERAEEAVAGTESDVLQSWRNALVHMPPVDTAASPPRRPSALGKCAYLGLSSEEHAREKQEDIAREERGWE